ncbi:MAG: hypothetical protein AB2401_04155, partial [Bacillus sp. (in: firmicutes)]
MSEIIATYLVHDAKHNPEKKAEEIALGLTVGSWTQLQKLEQEQLKKYKGRVISSEKLHIDEHTNETVAVLKIAYPSNNFSLDLPAILTTVFGKLSLDGKIKLLDLDFSEELKTALSAVDIKTIALELEIGELTLKDILDALVRPERDPRDELPAPLLKKDVLKLEDLKEGMELQGT